MFLDLETCRLLTQRNLGGVGFVGAIVGIWKYVKPVITVSPESTLVASNPFSANFKISNAGHLVQRSSSVSNEIRSRSSDDS